MSEEAVVSIKMIKLYFELQVDEKLSKKVKEIDVLRLECDVAFRTFDGEIKIYDAAIVDTGAFISLIPRSIWENVEHEKIASHVVRGIVPKKECSVDVIIGKIKIRLIDEENETNEMEVYAYLAMTDEVPLIIGFKDILTEFKISIDFKENEAFIEEK